MIFSTLFAGGLGRKRTSEHLRFVLNAVIGKALFHYLWFVRGCLPMFSYTGHYLGHQHRNGKTDIHPQAQKERERKYTFTGCPSLPVCKQRKVCSLHQEKDCFDALEQT